MLLELLKSTAVAKGLLQPEDEIDARTAFLLVRDMTYQRASSREPQTIIAEWRGTCSGKHYLLKALFAELGYTSRIMACTTVSELDAQRAQGSLRDLIIRSHGRFVDVHNYLVLELPSDDMIIDATWPLAAKGKGVVVNEEFVLGQNQQIAFKPLKTWVVPDEGDPQAFKEELLRANYTAEELANREAYIKLISELFKGS